jgi:predicted transcriptional regulator
MAEKTFTNIPSEMMRDTTLTPATKLVLGYIYTRSLIKDTEWEVVASNVETECGLSQTTASKLIRVLQKQGILSYKETRRHGGEWAYKVFTINKDRLNVIIFEKGEVKKTVLAESKKLRGEVKKTSGAESKRLVQEDTNKKRDNKSIKEEAKTPESFNNLLSQAQAVFDSAAPKTETPLVALKEKESIQPVLSVEQIKQLDADWETIRKETLKSQGMSQGYFNTMRSLAASPKFSPLGYKI